MKYVFKNLKMMQSTERINSQQLNDETSNGVFKEVFSFVMEIYTVSHLFREFNMNIRKSKHLNTETVLRCTHNYDSVFVDSNNSYDNN